MVVFGDSTADAGRRFNAPTSFDFDDIGPFPWTRLFEAPDSNVRENATSFRISRLVGIENNQAYVFVGADTLRYLPLTGF